MCYDNDHNHCSVLSYCFIMASLYFAQPPPHGFDCFCGRCRKGVSQGGAGNPLSSQGGASIPGLFVKTRPGPSNGIVGPSYSLDGYILESSQRLTLRLWRSGRIGYRSNTNAKGAGEGGRGVFNLGLSLRLAVLGDKLVHLSPIQIFFSTNQRAGLHQGEPPRQGRP